MNAFHCHMLCEGSIHNDWIANSMLLRFVYVWHYTIKRSITLTMKVNPTSTTYGITSSWSLFWSWSFLCLRIRLNIYLYSIFRESYMFINMRHLLVLFSFHGYRRKYLSTKMITRIDNSSFLTPCYVGLINWLNIVIWSNKLRCNTNLNTASWSKNSVIIRHCFIT